MKSSNRFLLGFGIAITILVVITITLVLVNPGSITLLPENTPQGSVQRFLLAIENHDLPKAYSYLNVIIGGKKLTYNDWMQSMSPRLQLSSLAWKASFGEINISGNVANVEVIIDIFQTGFPLAQTENYELHLINSRWLITSYPLLYWFY
jgi:hypothetical protein